MYGVKVAAAVVGGSVVVSGLIMLLIFGSMALLGPVVGAIVSVSIVIVALFAAIAILTNLS